MKVNHPDIEGVSNEVPADQVDQWVEQGWVAEKPAKKSTGATD